MRLRHVLAMPDRSASAEERGEWTLFLAGMLYRAYGLTQVGVAVYLNASGYPALSPMLWFTMVVVAESIVVIVACRHRRRIPARLMTADVAFLSCGLFAGAWLTGLRSDVTWINYMYSYTLITSVALGFAYRKYWSVLAATVALAASYVLSATLLQHTGLVAITPNTISYFTNTGVAWVVALYLRRLSREFDARSSEAVDRAQALARERERSRQARALHDRVLQTLETLARGAWLADCELRDQVAADAAWLRAFVAGLDSDPPPGQHDLLARLRSLVTEKARAGLRVELNSAQLLEGSSWRDALTQERCAALVGAASEALTNVTKHAGVDEAVMRISIAGSTSLTISIVDHGAGFDPAGTPTGLGLSQSIAERIGEVGGAVIIDSACGSGTCVELMVPLAPQPSTVHA